MPLVSVVMPMYNQEKYIEECLKSVINQTLADIEIIVVNDGSNDNSLHIVKSYAEQDSRIIIIDKENTGYGHSMNIGFDLAKGEYIGIVETDDYVMPDMFEILYRIASENDLDFIKADFYRFYGDETNRTLDYGFLTKDKSYYNHVINPQTDRSIFNLTMMNWSGIYKKQFLVANKIRHNETPGASYQDNGFWFQVFSLGHRCYFVDKPFYCVRRDNPNSSINSKGKVFCISEEYANIYRFICTHPEIKPELLPWFAKALYGNYVGVLNRIGEQYKSHFLKKFARDFDNYIRIGEIRKEYFQEKSWNRIMEIIRSNIVMDNCVLPVNVKRTYDYLSKLPEHCYPDELKTWYKRITKDELNLLNPITFNDKIQWSKLYDSTPLKAILSDKYAVRSWVKSVIGEEYLIPLLGKWNTIDEINFDELPNKFALKTNHGSGWNYIITDKSKINLEKLKTDFKEWLCKSFGYMYGLELQYNLIEPCILAEEYQENENNELRDYKFLCFNGKVKYIWVDTGRYTDHRRDLFDTSWNHVDVKIHYPNADNLPAKPKKLDEMINLAQKLSVGFPYVRVDLYYLNNDTIKFGEMTFTSGSGTEKFEPDTLCYELGSAIQLPIDINPLVSPKISIILPIYNAEKTIRYVLNSIIRQTYPEFEVLCIDNNSSDGTYSILQEYVNIDKRIKIFDQIESDFNQSRSYGFLLSKGRYIMFASQTCVLYSNCIFEQVLMSNKKSYILSKKKFKDKVFELYINKNPGSESNFPFGLERILFEKELLYEYRLKIIHLDSNELCSLIVNTSTPIELDCSILDLSTKDMDTKPNLYVEKPNIDVTRIEDTNEKTILQLEKHILELREEIRQNNLPRKSLFSRIFKRNQKKYASDSKGITTSPYVSKYVTKQLLGIDIEQSLGCSTKCHSNPIKISTIVPVYNAAPYLRECIESLVNQFTTDSLEFIFVDDGSTDDSASIIESYMENDPRILLLKQENKGAGIARNYGLSVAKGEYVHFLDADDWIDLDAYSTLLKKISVEKPDLCLFFYRNYDNISGEFTSVYEPIRSEQKYTISNVFERPNYFLNNSFVVPWNKIYKKSFLESNSIKFTKLNCANDRPFYFEILLKTKSIMVLDATLINYRVNNKSSLVGINRSKNYHCQFEAFEFVEPLYRASSNDILKKFLMITMGDFFCFYGRSLGEDRKKIEQMLHEYFQKLDLSPIGKDITKCWWYNDYLRIKEGR